MIDLQTTWFLLIGILLAGYAVLDGFDLGVGVLHLFAKDEQQRKLHLAAISPVWDGNEVWLLTAGGAMFAAFPIVYAGVFSGFYLAFVLLLVGLIFRAVSIEFRGQVENPTWQRSWDWAFGLGSLLPAILFGVAIGNILRGLPVEADGNLHVTFFSLLNPFSILMGVFSLTMFVMHGSAFMGARCRGELQTYYSKWTVAALTAFAALFVVISLATWFTSPSIISNALDGSLGWIVLAVFVGATIGVPLALRAGKHLGAFLASAVAIASTVGLIGLGLYPNMVPSSIDAANNLTIYNSSSSDKSLAAMLVIALIGMPLVIGYTACAYKLFMGKLDETSQGY